MSFQWRINQLMAAERVYVDAPGAEVQPSWWGEAIHRRLNVIERLRTLHGRTHNLEDIQATLVDDGDRIEAALAVHELLVLGAADVIIGDPDDPDAPTTIALATGEHDEHQEYVEQGPIAVVPRWDGGLNITLRLAPEIAAHVHGDPGPWQLADRMHAMLSALARVRDLDHELPAHVWAAMARDLEVLRQQAAAIQAATIRAHEGEGGTIRGLAADMDLPHTTVQRRREAAADLTRPYTSWVTSGSQR